MEIKVCGLKYPDNIQTVAALTPAYIGFICYRGSPRFINNLDADNLVDLPAQIFKTGVFVNESEDEIDRLIKKYDFTAIQLHGNESPDFCKKFKGHVQVIKAFGLNDEFDFGVLEEYQPVVDYFLFDTKSSSHGGTGKQFNWEILSRYKLDMPFFLSGGLSLENLNEVKAIKHPKLYGVDLNSRFESDIAVKDIEKLKKAFTILK